MLGDVTGPQPKIGDGPFMAILARAAICSNVCSRESELTCRLPTMGAEPSRMGRKRNVNFQACDMVKRTRQRL